MRGTGRKREARSTLLHFVQALSGLQVVAELRNDTVIRGKLEHVDDQMNLTMAKVSLQLLQGKSENLELTCVKGRHIRYIHLPGSLDATNIIEKHGALTREQARMNMRDQQCGSSMS